MDAGRILQTGTPREIYERPAQLAVARFLGRNNLIGVMRLSAMHDSLAKFKTLEGGHTLTAHAQGDALAPINQPCTLAIRPEHVHLNDVEASGENVLHARVREINFAGATTTVRLDADGLQLEALLLSPDGLKAGDACTVTLPTSRIIILRSEKQVGRMKTRR
jgi:ABC-type Fe3+/spermidine/putrescine transport system ATPase subunit